MTDLSMAMTKATNDLTYTKTKRDEAEAVLIKTKASLDNITKDDKDYPKFRCIYLKALIVFKKVVITFILCSYTPGPPAK
jgi:hypothetical protein